MSFVTYRASGTTDAGGAAVLVTEGYLDETETPQGDGVIVGGLILSVQFNETVTPPDATVDFTVVGETTRTTILTVTNVTVPAQYCPTVGLHTVDGVTIPTTDFNLRTPIAIVNEKIEITVAGAGASKLITVDILIAEDPTRETDV